MKHLLLAGCCAALLAGCGGDSSSGAAPRRQTTPTPVVSELQAQRLKPNALEQAPTAGRLPAHLKPPRI